MMVQVSIERIAEEDENAEELVETADMPFGSGQTVGVFEYDPTSQEHWNYLLDLQELLFQLYRHEMKKAHDYLAKEQENVGQ